MIPIMATPGNHEYNKHRLILSPVWSAQFDFPDNGPDHAKLNETVYYIDYQGVRFISLNSHVMYKELWPRLTFMQAKWLKKVLAQNPHKWTIVFHHHPMFASSMTRGDHFWLKHQFKDIYEHYGVDLVFQGHDHNYARGDAASKADDDQGPIYITSVSGGKVYKVNATWADARADTLQLFQHIEVGENRLRYRSFDTVGALNDRFVLTKDADGRKHLTETNAGG
jgi:3',5'-cyclic AMP phosphodiesterase CpdA